MIVIEITDESGLSHYDILGIKKEDLDELDEKTASSKVQIAARKAKGKYQKLSQRGDKEAEDLLAKVNLVETTLKKREEREKYNKELESGKGATLEIFRIQRVGGPFFWDRNVRYRAIERMMREAGMARPIQVEG